MLIAYDFEVSAPTLNTSYQATMTDFVAAAPQYALDIITNNLPMFLFFVICSLGLGIGTFIGRMLMRDRSFSLTGSSSMANGVRDGMIATAYLDSGGDIRNASNQEFIRSWGKSHGY